MASQPPPIGAEHIDYRGNRSILGRTSDSYALWDAAGGPPIQSFPLTNHGWEQAWRAYQEREGPSAQAQAAAAQQQAATLGPSPTLAWRRGQPLTMQPMRVGQILDGAFKLYRMQFRTLVPLVAFVVVPFEVIVLLLSLATLRPVFVGAQFQVVQEPALWVTFGAAGLQLLFITPFLTAAVVRTAGDAYLGHPTSVGASYSAALPKILSVLWVTFLVFLMALVFAVPGILLALMGEYGEVEALTGVGGLLLLAAAFPIILFILRWLFGTSIVVLEGVRGTQALRRSWRLAYGLTGKILGTMLLTSLILFALLFVVGAIMALILLPTLQGGGGIGPGFYAVNHAFNTVITILTTPFTTLVIVLLYFDARIRKEGFDLEVMAQQLGQPAPGGA